MSEQKVSLNVAVGGLGAIGFSVAKCLSEGGIPGLNLAAVSARDHSKAYQRLSAENIDTPVVELAKLANVADVVIECAPAAVFDDVAVPAIAAGCVFMPLSVGALLERNALVEQARQTGAKIIVPSGAMLGLDALKGVSEGRIDQVKLVTRKPISGLSGAPYLIEHGIDIESLNQPLQVFCGSARDAARAFPANVNVAAALSLAGFGADRTEVEIWADPNVTRNTHKVTVDADCASFSMEIRGVPDPDNPRTGLLTPRSVIACLRRLTSPLVVGT
jgi:aspartate dehydrogenase